MSEASCNATLAEGVALCRAASRGCLPADRGTAVAAGGPFGLSKAGPGSYTFLP